MPSHSDPEPLISLAENYDVSLQHVEKYIVMVVTQSEPLTEDQVALFPTATMYQLAHARGMSTQDSTQSGPNCSKMT